MDLEVHVPPTRSRTPARAVGASSVLPALAELDLAPPAARLVGRPLRPVPFRPEAGRPAEADGQPLTKLGWRFREVFARAHGIADAEVDLGLVRQVEALNADTDRNLAALSAPQTKRTEQGGLLQVRMTVNTPVLLPWLLNGRALRRMAIALQGSSRLVTYAVDHPRLALPTLTVGSPDNVLEIVGAQKRLLGLASYNVASAKQKDRIDSILRFGVLDPPDVVLTQLVSDRGSAWTGQAAEGAQRLFMSLLGMDGIANRSCGSVATAHWFDGEDPALRDLRPDDLVRLEEALAFASTEAAAFFPGADVQTWLDTTAATTPAAVAFQLLRTIEINLVIAVDPDPRTADPRNPASSTVQELIRGYHVPGKAKDSWLDADVQGLIAIGAIDELMQQGRVTARERSAWLGESVPDWSGPSAHADGGPGNRVVTVASLLAALTARGAVPASAAAGEDSLEVVNRHLYRNGSKRVHPDDRAKVAAAQAIGALSMYGSGQEGTVAAALYGVFHAPLLWKQNEHPGGPWTPLLTVPLAELSAKARAERAASAGRPDAAPQPAQRALAALGAVALIANPGLVAAGKALTRTGRGGGGKAADVKASDPSILLGKMIADERGIDQLTDAVASLVAGSQPTVPIDRVDGKPLEDLYLRGLWLGQNRDGDTADNAVTEFARQIGALIEAVRDAHGESERLRTAKPDDLLDVPADQHELLFEEDAMFESVGVSGELADDVLPLLQGLSEFFTTGKAYARAAERAAR